MLGQSCWPSSAAEGTECCWMEATLAQTAASRLARASNTTGTARKSLAWGRAQQGPLPLRDMF